MEIRNLENELNSLAYHGRGIIIGKSADSKRAVTAYFIMGRSENSRNRVFVKDEEGIKTKAFDESKVEDPSLIIYYAVREYENKLIATNGDQTDTIYNFLKENKGFKCALKTREFEPDAPNFTPRISGMVTYKDNDFTYEMSILKSIDEVGSKCARYHFDYPSVNGLGHFIHTYENDGNPIPTFQGEPERVKISGTIEEFTDKVWNSLNQNNKISLYVRYTNLQSGEITEKIVNKNK